MKMKCYKFQELATTILNDRGLELDSSLIARAKIYTILH